MTETATGWTVLDHAHNALRAAVAGVAPDGWDAASPCAGWTVAQVLQHAAGDQEGYAAPLGVGTGPDGDPFAPTGALADEPTVLLERALHVAARAFRGVPADATDVAVPVPPGSLPAELAAAAAAMDAAVHAWDIAVATGQDSPLTDELAAGLLPVAHAIVEPLRAFAFAPALPTQDGDGPAEELLRFLGRDPRWSASEAAGRTPASE